MEFNPAQYRITESAEFEVPDAQGNIIYLDAEQTKPWTITVASPGTKRALRARKELEDAAQGDLFGQMKGRKSKKDEESDIRLRAEFLSKITMSTNADNLVYNGATGMDALKAIYLDPFMQHVAIGLDGFHGDRGNFAPGSQTNSSTV